MRNLSQLTVNTGDSFEKLCPFPVGYIYLSTDSTSPASTYGGTWSELTDSRFLRPSGSWNSTGGANSHYHWTTQGYGYAEPDSYAGGYTNLDGSQPSRTKTGPHFPITSTKKPFNGLYRENGTYTASSLPPYRTCYAWYRTA